MTKEWEQEKKKTVTLPFLEKRKTTEVVINRHVHLISSLHIKQFVRNSHCQIPLQALNTSLPLLKLQNSLVRFVKLTNFCVAQTRILYSTISSHLSHARHLAMILSKPDFSCIYCPFFTAYLVEALSFNQVIWSALGFLNFVSVLINSDVIIRA